MSTPSTNEIVAALRASLGDVERLQQENSRLVQERREPIAIVGMGCRLPGGVRAPAELWDLLVTEQDAISEFPPDRGWDRERLYDPDPDCPGTSYVRAGGFIEDVGDFDAAFFGVSPREALAMDPQQRLLLEVCWEAIEDARLDPLSLRGSATGVFAGISMQDYLHPGQGLPAELEGHGLTGAATSVASGRVAYTLGLQGPAVTIDTACSSSLVALHLACSALRANECSLALAGGATVIATPGLFTEFSRQRGLAPDGRCKPFSDRADGASMSEGVGVVVLERLSDALRNAHRVLAVVRGSAVNQDGASNGLSAPNGPSQQRVIMQALANAGLSPHDVDALEAHGTGTTLGDPIEAQAVLATYGAQRSGRPLWMGSVKSNLGHTQAAAGVAGVIKMVLALRHQRLPRTLHVERPSSEVDWSAGEVSLLTEPLAWEDGTRTRRAAVSSFGISGTNAHVILEQAPPELEQAPRRDSFGGSGEEQPAVVAWPVSAKGTAALRAQADRLRERLKDTPQLDTMAVAASLARKPALADRALVVGRSPEQLLERLDRVARGASAAGVIETAADRQRMSGGVWLFPGQGSQWSGMAADLLDSSPVFRDSILACQEALAPYVDWSLEEVLRGDGAEALERVDVVQPALFAVMVSLAALWRAAGVRPSAVVGHSQGEIAAAHVAGGLSLQDAARIVALRSQALTALAGKGAMASISLSPEEVSPLLEHDASLALAAVNGPRSVVVSGEASAVQGLLERCAAQDVRARAISVDYAAHSPAVEAIRDQLLDACAPVAPRGCEVPFYSTVTGELLDTDRLDADYWYRNLRETVRLEPVTRSLIEQGHAAFVELSPHPVLAVAVQETAESIADGAPQITVTGSLRRDEDSQEAFLSALGSVWAQGVEVDWQAIACVDGTQPVDARLVDLPTYAFQRRRYWLKRDAGPGDLGAAGLLAAGHPLLGAAVWLADGDGLLFTGQLSLETHGWLADHAVMGAALLPGAAFLELALHAAARSNCDMVEELTLEAPLVLREEEALTIQLSVTPPDEAGARKLAIYSRPAGASGHDESQESEWTRNASGVLAASALEGDDHATDLDAEWPPARAKALALDDLYDRLAELEFDYGPAFRGLRAAWRRGADLFAEVKLPEQQQAEAERFGLHPALFDAALQVPLAGALADMPSERDGEGMRLPFAWRAVSLHARGACALRVHLRESPDGALSLRLSDAAGARVASVGSLVARPPVRAQLAPASADPLRRALFQVSWSKLAPLDRLPLSELALVGDTPDWLKAVEHAKPRTQACSDVASLAQSLAGEAAPQAAIAFCGERSDDEHDAVAAAHSCVKRTLALLQAWLAEESVEGTPLVLLTEGAVVACRDDGECDPVAGAVWGLVRSAQAEHPGRFVLCDIDREAASWESLPSVFGLDEPQVALRDGQAFVPRLTEAPRSPADGTLAGRFAALGPGESVLITGGTGLLGSLVARHLVVRHGVRELVLTSRSGLAAAGARDLHEELTALGADVTVVACDTSDRSQISALLAQIGERSRLRAVVHAAGLLDEGVLNTLTPEQVERVFAPKVDAAWYLHELTAEADLAAFVLFSSAAGVFGAAGQANYAAANAFLDALAALRRARGLPGTSIAWGLWAPPSAMTGHLQRAHVKRIQRAGLEVLQVEHGLELFDAVREPAGAPPAPAHPIGSEAAIGRIDESTVIAAPLDLSAARREARAGGVAPLLRGMVRVAPHTQRERAEGTLAGQLAGLSEEERRRALLELVRGEAAVVLGHRSASAVEASHAFKELGFDSLLAVELRNRLSTLTGSRLPATVVFDHPTPQALAGHLASELSGVRSRARPRRAAQAADEPIAIVGMACRYPGGVSTPEDLWQLLSAGGDAISGFPEDRGWDLERLYDPSPDSVGTSYTRQGGFLADATEFDPGFFGIGPSEALAMDAQQRLMLEACWEALESGWIDPAALRGSSTGVFAGVVCHLYAGTIAERIPTPARGYLGVGGAASVVAGRVAYTLGLEGPALTVDTACSSSLVAMHLACQALRAGECGLALAGGVTVMPTPAIFVDFSHQRNLAPDGRCKAFADGADGTSLSEGVGVLLLQRLSDALEEKRPVLALVRGSAVNQDGRSNGLTAPNGPSQQRVIAGALLDAGLSEGDVDAVEAHGTGTTLGDPIEAQALLATYGQRPPERRLWLGSIKSNVGHTQGAAGVAGVIKMVLAMRHGLLPRTLHVDEPSRKVDWSAGAVSLLNEPVAWERDGSPRRAGVSSFGISGTNAHLILEEPPQGIEQASAPNGKKPGVDGGAALDARAPMPWLVSARSESGLRAQAGRLLHHLSRESELRPIDVGLSLAAKPALEERAVLVGVGRQELDAALRSLCDGRPTPNVIRGRARQGGALAFLFTGQGAQRVGMGAALYDTFAAFRTAFDETCEQLDPLLARPLREISGIGADATPEAAELLDRTAFTQPALFALEVALFRLLEGWGLQPEFLLGHSVGELAAAHVAGVMSLPDACALVAARARLMDALAGGAMAAVEASEEEALASLAEVEHEVALAAVNGPRSVVLSGDARAVTRLVEAWAARGRKTRRLRVSHAFHSPHMDAMLDEFAEIAGGISLSRPLIRVVSNVTGKPISDELRDPRYWASHVRGTVRFADGVRSLLAEGVRTFIELGPDGVLSAMADDCSSAPGGDSVDALAVPLLSANRSDGEALMAALGQAWTAGVAIDWSRMLRDRGAQRVALPTYAFQRQRYWLNHAMPDANGAASLGQSPAEHPLLGAALPLAEGHGVLFTARLSTQSAPWLAEHVVLGNALLPGAALLELALHAGAQVGCERVEELIIDAPLPVSARGLQLQLTLGEPDAAGVRALSVHSRPEELAAETLREGEGWTRHAHGALAPRVASEPRVGQQDVAWPPEGARAIDTEDLYETLGELGFDYGPSFRGLTGAWRCGEDLYAQVSLTGEGPQYGGAFVVHPALLDAALHVVAAEAAGRAGSEGELWLPFSWSGVQIAAQGARALRVRLSRTKERSLSLTIADGDGRPVGSVDALQLGRIEREQLGAAAAVDRSRSLFALDWREAGDGVSHDDAPSSWALLGTSAGALSDCLRLAGIAAVEHADVSSLIADARTSSAAPEMAIAAAPSGAWADGKVIDQVHGAVRDTLELLQQWLAAEDLAASRLVLVSRGGVATEAQAGVSDPAAAAVWGLVRSAQSESPDRVLLLDIDDDPASWRALSHAIAAAVAAGEPQLALRQGRMLVPRLLPAEPQIATPNSVFDGCGTVLVTGALGGIGALIAKHLVTEHGVRNLLLVGRRGSRSANARELRAELRALGASVSVRSCDIGDRAQVRSLLASISEERPLTGVVHAAGVLEDGVLGSLSGESVDRVLLPKVDGAWHLHELTRELDLRAFVLFSSAAGTLGGPGQANYAAANAFLDALAAQRRMDGVPGTSIAWGPWSVETGMAGSLRDSDVGRMARSGVRPLSPQEALALFDAVCATRESTVLAARLEQATLRAHAKSGQLPAIMRGLVRASASARSDAPTGSLAGLAGMSAAERARAVLELVRAEAASVLGADLATVAPQRAFLELGFDSLSALELRNRLAAATGRRLPATLIFDYPSPQALAQHLLETLVGEAQPVARRSAATVSREEPIAIVGMSCRYPGGVASPEELWELLAAGGDAISPFPTDRGWDIEALYDPDPARAGTTYTREGGFLLDAGEFDAAFFGIGAREALAMDPQQRLMLEASWEALEDGGIDPLSLRGSQTGVFAGAMYQDYALGGDGSVLASLEGYLGTGNAGSVVSGRVAYALGLEGPAVSINTACSSSLVATHLACQALRAGECALALAGGVTVMWTPVSFIEFARQRGLARDGRCKAYASNADGVGWSEGVGLLVLERLSDAQRLGHRALALVRGSAVNQDGASSGLTAPNGPSQQRVIRQALGVAGLESHQIDAIEGHGTGTKLGDPIEVQALLATYGQRSGRGPAWLGSIKSNIGHAQGAAGVAGVIKMVMALQHETLPRTLYVEEPSREVDWSTGEIALLDESVPWPGGSEPRRAAVSSFGISGTNAHLILEEAPAQEPVKPAADARSFDGTPLPCVLSAKGQDALRAQARRLVEHVRRSPELGPLDVACSLSTRTALEHRAVVFGAAREELLSGLESLARDEPAESVVASSSGAEPLTPGATAFMFTGQGSQRVGMGAELYRAFPTYAHAFDEVCRQLSGHLGSSLADLVLADPTKSAERDGDQAEQAAQLDHTAFAQAGLFALEVALFRLLESYGARPDFLIGHSIGELAAAHVAGVFSLEDACSLVAARGRLMGELPADGAMVAVQVSEREALAALAGHEQHAALAAVNGPASVVISGQERTVLGLAQRWRDAGRKTKRLRVSHAFHSPQTDALLERFADAVRAVERNAPCMPVVSNLTGMPVSTEEVRSVDYWVRHMRETVRFGAGIGWLYEHGARCFVELGPDAVLSAMSQESLRAAAEPAERVASDRYTVASLLRAGRPESQTFTRSLAELFVSGAELDWTQAFSGLGARRVRLPTYAFQRRRYWLTPASGAGDARALGQSPTGHGMLGASVELAEERGAVFTGRLSLESQRWLADHMVMGAVLLPASAFLDMALYAGGELGAGLVSELTLEEPLVLDERTAVRVQVTVREPDESGTRRLSIHSREATDREDGSNAGRWVRHATGALTSVELGQGVAQARLLHGDRDAADHAGTWPPPEAEQLALDDLYELVAERGLQYGPTFRCLKRAWRAGTEIFAELALPEEQRLQAERFALHPGLLDAAFHAVLASDVDAARRAAGDSLSIPFQFAGVALHATGASMLRVTLRSDDLDSLSLLATDDTGLPVASLGSVRAREISSEQLARRERSRGVEIARDALFTLEWIESQQSTDPAPGSPSTSRQWALLGSSLLQPGEASSGEASGGEASVANGRYADLGALVQALDAGTSAPDLVLFDCTSDPSDEDVVRSAHAAVKRTLALLQGWLSERRLSASQLVMLTRGAVAVEPGESMTSLADAAIWGLVGSAQAENPGRFALVDHDGEGCSWDALTSALLSGEPRLVVRGGRVMLARLQRAGDDRELDARAFAPRQTEHGRDRPGFGAHGTVLITGGTGGLGALLARHLVREHGVRSLLLTSRSGPQAPGAGALQRELTELGAAVQIAACDVSDRQALAALISSIDEQRPLRGVVHAAGVLDDGLIGSLTDERVDPVLAAKLDGAWHLHELTAGHELDAFVLFSSVAGALGSPGQGAYAAANAFLDALAFHRRAAGLPAVSLAWGAWEEAGMAARQRAAELHSDARSGVRPLAVREALELFDRALSLDRALLLPVRIDLLKLRERASAGTLPPLFAVLAPAARSANDASAGALRRRVLAAPEEEREALVLRSVREQAAVILGHSSPEAIDPRRSFKDLGFDSLAAVELRNRLELASGLRLEATLVFDYPDCSSLAAQLLDQLRDVSSGDSSGRSLDAELDALERMLSSLASDDPQRTRVAERLGAIASGLGAGRAGRDGSPASQDERSSIEQIEAASAEQIFELIDRQLASP